jgi:hypothetical protein
MSTTCTHHCRSCGSHFTSLEAFDAHRKGPAGSDRACAFPELPKGAEWVERTGACRIAGATPAIGVTVYALVREGKYGAEGRQAAEGSVREAA